MHRADYSFVCCGTIPASCSQGEHGLGVQGPKELKDNRAGAAGDGEREIPEVGLEMVTGISNMSYTRAVFDARGY